MRTSNIGRLRRWCTLAGAALLVPSAAAAAEVRCIESHFEFNPDGITNILGQTRAEQPCQIWFGRYSAIHEHSLTAYPGHGTVTWNQADETRHFIVYTPRPGYTGLDHFQLHVAFTPHEGKQRHRSEVSVNMTVTP